MAVGPPIMCALVLEDDPTGERLTFESYPYEEGIPENYQVNYKPMTKGSPEPLFWFYEGGAWSSFTLTLKFQAGLETDASASGLAALTGGLGGAAASDPKQILRDMENKVRWLQAISFQKPRQQRAPGELRTVVAGKPPIVLLVLGEFMTLRGLIFGVNANWAPPYHNESAQPYGAKVDLVFQRVSGFYPDFYSQKKGMTRLSASTTGAGGPNVEGRVVVG